MRAALARKKTISKAPVVMAKPEATSNVSRVGVCIKPEATKSPSAPKVAKGAKVAAIIRFSVFSKRAAYRYKYMLGARRKIPITAPAAHVVGCKKLSIDGALEITCSTEPPIPSKIGRVLRYASTNAMAIKNRLVTSSTKPV